KNLLSVWLILFLAGGLAFGIFRSFFRARKIQPNGFRWRTFRNEIFFALINLAVSAVVLGSLTSMLTTRGLVVFNKSPVSWWVVALEFTGYFFAFDCYFYWFHRLMHVEPIYRWVHKVHHYSTSPNVLTTLSVTPLESLVNGGFIPLFTALFTIHEPTMILISPFNMMMGFYVHTGYEFFPRWWNKSWATRWFITATFHDQHHKYFNYNFGGYTTIWDWVCGTVRPKFLADFDRIKARVNQPLSPSVAVASDS
ncbi:MAG: fatty acid hydroxylase, partial [Rhodospirillaceae bacterium]